MPGISEVENSREINPKKQLKIYSYFAKNPISFSFCKSGLIFVPMFQV